MDVNPTNPADRGGSKSAAASRWRWGVLAACAVGMVAWAGTTSYTYDSLGRLSKAVHSNGSTTTTVTYSYDAAGNRTSVVTTSP